MIRPDVPPAGHSAARVAALTVLLAPAWILLLLPLWIVSRWPFWSVAVWTFNLYGGSREFNPLGIVIRPWRTPKRFRFWRAFHDFKHGNSGTLHRVEQEFFDCINAV